MNALLKMIRPALASFGILTVVCGIAYPGLVTLVAQTCFREKANGSMVIVATKDDTSQTMGSELIAQEFTKMEYLIGRPAGTTNLSPTGRRERELVTERVAYWRSLAGDETAIIPADLVTASGSGIDPSISPEAAEFQVERIARARGISEDSVKLAITRNTKGRFVGAFGERSVNVLMVNLALDGLRIEGDLP